MAHDLTAAEGLAIEWVLTILALFFVVLRLYVRWFVQNALSVSDGFVALAMILLIVVTACDTYMWKGGLWEAGPAMATKNFELLFQHVPDKASLSRQMATLYAMPLPCFSSLWCVKAAFLLLYYKLIPRHLKGLRIALHAVAIITPVCWFVMECLNLFWCRPIWRNWTTVPEEACFSLFQFPPYFATIGLHLFTDALIYILPFFLLPHLQVSRKQKLALAAIFALGAFNIMTCVGRLVDLRGKATLPPLGAWTIVEMSTGIIVICLPPLKWLYVTHRDKSRATSAKATTDAAGEWGTVVKKSVVNVTRGPADDCEMGGRVVVVGGGTPASSQGEWRRMDDYGSVEDKGDSASELDKEINIVTSATDMTRR